MHIYVHRCSCWMYANNIVAFAHLAHKSCCSTRGQLATARRWTRSGGRAVRKSGRVHAWWHMSRQPSKQPTHFAKCHHFCFRSSTSVSTTSPHLPPKAHGAWWITREPAGSSAWLHKYCKCLTRWQVGWWQGTGVGQALHPAQLSSCCLVGQHFQQLKVDLSSKWSSKNTWIA